MNTVYAYIRVFSIKYIAISLLITTSVSAISQNDSIFDRLQGIETGLVNFYNVDGITFTKESFDRDFNEKSLKKAFRKYSVKKEPRSKDSKLKYEHIKVLINDVIGDTISTVNPIYFLKNTDGKLDVISFVDYNIDHPIFERKMIELILENEIPQSNFTSYYSKTYNFNKREINFGNGCRWMGVNNLQCPYNGQMDWSVHKTKKSATDFVKNKILHTKIKSGMKVISEEKIDVIFESKPATATKIIYDVTGINSLLARASGGKSLISYYIVEKVRGNFMSCTLSHWNNDVIISSGLPSLLDEVLQLRDSR